MSAAKQEERVEKRMPRQIRGFYYPTSLKGKEEKKRKSKSGGKAPYLYTRGRGACARPPSLQHVPLIESTVPSES